VTSENITLRGHVCGKNDYILVLKVTEGEDEHWTELKKQRGQRTFSVNKITNTWLYEVLKHDNVVSCSYEELGTL
jgi:hypothetical protein